MRMATIETITREINKELVPLFEERLRTYLAGQDRDWLVEQIVRLTLDAHSLHEMDRKQLQAVKAKKRAERISRLRELSLDRAMLLNFLRSYADYDRVRLIADGLLLPDAPAKGTDLIEDSYRTAKGTALLTYTKDILFGLLYGDESTNTRFTRTEQEMLTLTLPRGKVEALDFMKATTEMSAFGTWQDPESVSNDMRADNVIVEVEYGEVEGELIGNGIVRTLGLINNLEVNEQILYARMVNVEQSTLIE
jgi:hypothetical protein